jgi:hypothetical protein
VSACRFYSCGRWMADCVMTVCTSWVLCQGRHHRVAFLMMMTDDACIALDWYG